MRAATSWKRKREEEDQREWREKGGPRRMRTQGGLLEDGDEMGVVLFFLPEGAPAKADQ